MAAPLFPVFPTSSPAAQAAAAAPKFGTSYLFDFEAGDFVVDGSGRVQTADGQEAWRQWCVKACLTERFEHLVYGPGYGAENGRVRGAVNLEAAKTEAERAITEALLADPRTAPVTDFDFGDSAGDELRVSFTVTPAVGDPTTLEVMLT